MTQQVPQGRFDGRVALVLALIGFALLLFPLRGCLLSPPWFEGYGHRFGYSVFGPFYSLLGIWGIIQVGLAIWVGIDANRKGSNGILWGLLVLFTSVVGLIVYLLVSPNLVRNGASVTAAAPPGSSAVPPPSPGKSTCPSCRAQVEPSFKACPYCGTSLHCPQCDKPIEGGWRVCPYCTAPLGSPPG